MKRFLILCFTFMSLFSGAFSAQSKYAETLYKIEEELYGINYADQNDETRINRLEKSVYGTVSSKKLDDRIKKLSEDLSADVLDEKISPTEDTFSEELAEDSSVRYPALDRVETKLFSKTYDKSELGTRIVRIEKHLFNNTYDNEDYHSRVERIKNNVFKNDYQMASNDAYYDDMYYKSDKGFSSNDLSGLNRNLYNRGSASSFSQRLAGLENQILGDSYEFDTEEERFNRLNSAYRAQKSIKKYDSNSFQQKMSTAMQVGAMILMMLCMVL